MTRRPNTEARAGILRAAHELYSSGGFEAVSMERVAEKAGLKKANLFHYYRTKEALGKAVIEEAARRHAEGMRALFADGTRDPAAAVGALFDRAAAGMRKDCSRGCFIGKLGQELDERNGAMRRKLSACFSEWRAEVEAFLEGWRKRGYFRPGFKPAEAADGILSLYEGGMLLAKMAGEPSPAEHARRAAAALIGSWRA